MASSPYVPPNEVISPQKRLKNLKVLNDFGENDWSLAEGDWFNEHSKKFERILLIRWNGDLKTPKGHPSVRGFPTWFAAPNWARDKIIKAAEIEENNRGK